MEYAVAYLRLSKEDENKGEESGSISNQRKIIKAYCERTGLCLVHEFVDDDFSGGNFNRPGFQEMLRYLDEHREIGTLITKDLSRLGRDMSESSFYAERYFPEHDIHYLAIDDSYDSEKENLLAVDVVPDISVHDDAALVAALTAEVQPLVPGLNVSIAVDHFYCE